MFLIFNKSYLNFQQTNRQRLKLNTVLEITSIGPILLTIYRQS